MTGRMNNNDNQIIIIFIQIKYLDCKFLRQKKKKGKKDTKDDKIEDASWTTEKFYEVLIYYFIQLCDKF